MPFLYNTMPFSSVPCPFSQTINKMPYILVKKSWKSDKKLRKLQIFQFEAWSSMNDTCCCNILPSVNSFSMVTNYWRQFWHITLMTKTGNTPISNYLKYVNMKYWIRYKPQIVKINTQKNGKLAKIIGSDLRKSQNTIQEKKIPKIMWFWFILKLKKK